MGYLLIDFIVTTGIFTILVSLVNQFPPTLTERMNNRHKDYQTVTDVQVTAFVDETNYVWNV